MSDAYIAPRSGLVITLKFLDFSPFFLGGVINEYLGNSLLTPNM